MNLIEILEEFKQAESFYQRGYITGDKWDLYKKEFAVRIIDAHKREVLDRTPWWKIW